MDAMLDLAAVILILIGALLCLTAAVGVLRFRDVPTRLHAATKPQVLGLILICLAIALSLRSWPVVAFLVPVVLMQLATAPVPRPSPSTNRSVGSSSRSRTTGTATATLIAPAGTRTTFVRRSRSFRTDPVTLSTESRTDVVRPAGVERETVARTVPPSRTRRCSGSIEIRAVGVG